MIHPKFIILDGFSKYTGMNKEVIFMRKQRSQVKEESEQRQQIMYKGALAYEQYW
jgi:hypothetical protein